jgi:hypothetical protein
MLGIWLLYAAYGHRVIQEMYAGRSVWPLNGVIRNWNSLPLEHYLKKADGIFLRILFLPLFSFFFYKYLFKVVRYFFKKIKEAGSARPEEEKRYFRYDLLILYVAVFLSLPGKHLNLSDWVAGR